MTIRWECEIGDYSSSSNKIEYFQVTDKDGVSVDDLRNAELAEFRSLFAIHAWDHPEHSATWTFSIPEGYVEREGIIYKASK